MKTRRQPLRHWLACSTFVLLAAGCGTKTVESGERTSVPGSNAPSSVAVTEPASTNAAAVVGEAASAPAVKLTDRTTPPLKPEIQEVVRLVESGAGEEVVRAFVGSSSVPYDLALDEIILLRDIGVPDGVIAGMMRRGAELRAQQADAASLQTNLVAAVEQLKDAMQNQSAPGTGSATQPNAPEVAASSAPPPAPVAATQPPAEAPAAVQQFYTDLTPYGSWYQVPSYGWVWQPSVVVVNQGWTPYCHGGRWVWTDQGWYWNSDYSWGWAPFHYGRWATYPGIGWCWVPDTVWGPSWVTWRHSGTHIGWAPLPPACGWRSGFGLTWHGEGVSVGFGFGLGYSSFTFVEYSNFCHRNVGHRVVRGGRAEHIYQNSTVVNNVIQGNNNVIINNGVGYSNVANMVRGEIPKARVEPLPSDSPTVARADRMERSKDGFVVYKPTPVENAGGRPTALRSEVRPSSSSSGLVSSGRPMRSGTDAVARPTVGSRYGASTDGGAKSVESRSASGIVSAPAGRPSTSVSRPVTTETRPSAPASRTGGSRTGVAGGDLKSIETRAGNRPLNAPTRETAPVPLADPTRNIPARMREPSARPSVPVNPGKAAFESRTQQFNSSVGAPSPAERSPYSQPAPRVNAPSANRFTPQNAVPSYAPKTDYQRGAGSSAGGQTFSAPRPQVSTPSPSMAPPRSSYSAPAPSFTPPRPSGGGASGAAGPSPAPSGPSSSRNNPSRVNPN